jgi:arylsulfatase A-like enzyme
MRSPLLRRLKPLIRQVLPAPAVAAIATASDRLEEQRADRAFRRRSLPSIDRSPDAPKHVLCIVVDALRADHVDPDLMPYLDSLPGTTAIAPAPWTFPSVSSLLTGRYPHEHGAIRQTDDPDAATESEFTLPPKISTDTRTVMDYLAGAGYETYGGFAFHMPFLATSGRFHRHALYRDGSADRVLDEYLRWLSGRTESRTFAYIHLSDLHEPVEPPADYCQSHEVDMGIPDITGWDYLEGQEDEAARRYRSERRNLYRAGVEYVDDQLERVLGSVHDVLPVEPTIVVTSDHGEAFWEWMDFDEQHFYDSRPAYCVGHGGTPYESIARVPLHGSNVPSTASRASLVDVTPTILETVGIDVPEPMSGISLDATIPDDRIRLVEGARYGYEKKATYHDDWKLLVSRGDDEDVGFSLPEESVVALPSEVRERLEAAMPPWPDGDEERSVSPAVRSRLEELGYR